MSVFLIGTYGTGEKQGIWRLETAFSSPSSARVSRADDANQASYLCRRGDFVYALSETPGSGMLHAYRVENENLSLLNRAGGVEPILAHLETSVDGRYVLRISYGTGHIGTYSVKEDGSLGAPAGLLQHTGCGPFKGRQGEAHGHSITPTPDGEHLLACDLGTDDVLCLDFDPETGAIAENPSMGAKLPGGTGPRQQAWHPDGSCVYIVTEMGYQLATLGWSAETGLSMLDCRDIRPDMPKRDREGAAVKVSPDGRFVYTTCRWDGMLDIFSVGPDRIPTRIATVSSGVEQPRDFLITRDGRHLLAAGQRSGDLCVFERDPVTGTVTPSWHIGGFEKPVCLMEL